MAFVFISHSRENGSTALKLCQRLNERGVETWLDTLQLEGGEDWQSSVASAVEAAAGVIVLVGPSSSPDSSQRFEWQQITEREYYLDPAKAVVPIVLGAAELPGFLRTRQALVISPTGIDFDALADKVAGALGDPSATIDQERMDRGRAARERALENLKEYSHSLEVEDVKRAGLRGLK